MADPSIQEVPQAIRAEPLADVVCLGCGCLCDDLSVSLTDRSTTAEGDGLAILPSCSMARDWLAGTAIDDGPACMVEGRATLVEEGLKVAREILASSKRLLVDGLARTSVQSQRAAVVLAEKYRGVLIGFGSPVAARMHRAAQSAGLVTSTLGEVRHRADMVVLWNADPVTTHPRHLDRYSLYPEGRFVPRGRKDRTLVWIGSTPNPSRELADYVVTITAGRDFEAASVLIGIERGVELDADEVARQTGVPLETWQELSGMLRRARYGALFYDPQLSAESAERCEHDARALMQWVSELNSTTSFVFHALTDGGNGAGLEQVVSWMTGCSGVIDFSSGWPRVLPEIESSRDLMAHRSLDAALFVSADPLEDWGPSHWRGLGFIPTVVLSSTSTATSSSATVWFQTAPFGRSVEGTVFRGDGVALPLRPLTRSNFPSDEEILRQLAEDR
jgi:formylmethanofuran dehydrogenase subunit B